MMSKKKFMAAVMRGFEVSGMNALAQAGYSEATPRHSKPSKTAESENPRNEQQQYGWHEPSSLPRVTHR